MAPRQPPERELRSFGRRRGRKPSAHQDRLVREALPGVALDLGRPAPVRLGDLFGAPVRDVWLEIGFGAGEHLLWQAEHHPDIGLIGCEPYHDGIVKVLAAIVARGLRTVRLYADDARDVLRWLPPMALGQVFILYPDPWPKQRHHKRRLLSAATLGRLAHLMRPGAELRIATDAAEYAETILAAIEAEPALARLLPEPDWRIRPCDWPVTRYEEKAERDGRGSFYIAAVRR